MFLNETQIEFTEITRRKQYQLMLLLLSQNISFYQQFVYQNEQPLLHNLILEKQVEVTHYVINIIQQQYHNPLELLDQQNSLQQTPLMFASFYGLTSIIKHLLKAGAHINHKDQYGYSPLLFAMKNNQTYIVIYLVFKGAEINVQDKNGCSLAHLAAYNNNLFILKILRNVFKFNIFEKDKKDKTPLMRAEEQYAFQCQRYLQEQIQNKKNYSKFKKMKCSYQKEFNFLMIVILNIYLLILFIDFYEQTLLNWEIQLENSIIIKIIGNGSYFLQVLNLLCNYILFYLIESSPQCDDGFQHNSSNHSSLNLSNEAGKEIQGCFEIDQSCVPLIQEEQGSNLSFTQISENFFEFQKPLIKYILQSLENNKPVGLEVDQMCVDCLILKLPKTQHCEYCKVCHSNFQMHSSFYHKCIQNDWTFQFYFFIIIIQLVSYIYYLYIYLNSIDFSYKQIEFNSDLLFSVIIFIITGHYFIYSIILIYSIVSRKTYYELMNQEKCWYRYKTIIQSNQLAIRVLK